MTIRASLALSARVVRGTGRAGLIRTLVLVGAMALAVAGALVISFVPATAAHRARALQARSLQSAAPGQDHVVEAEAVDAAVGDRPLHRIFLGPSSGGPIPPGVDHAPRPGQVLASPALRSLLEREPFVRSLVPGHVVGTVAGAALTDPDELFAYVGVGSSADLQPAAGFGAVADLAGDTSTFTALQLSLFVLVPAGGFLVVAATLSSRARGRRREAMRSVGVPEPVIGRVAALETGLVAVVGGACGLLIVAALRPVLTSAGVGGVRWFATDLRLTPLVTVVSLVVVAALGGWLGRRAARLPSADPVEGSDRRPHLVRRSLPLVCGVTMLSSIVLLHRAGRHVQSAPVLLVAVVLAVSGLGAVLVPLVGGVGRVVACRSRRLAWRLGGHRAAHEPRSIVRVLAGLVALTVVGHLTFAVLADLRLAVGGDLGRAVAGVSLDDASPSQLHRLGGLRPLHAGLGHTAMGDPDAATIAFVGCRRLERLVTLTRPCRRGDRYRVSGQGFGSDLQVGRAYRFETRRGGLLTVRAPARSAVDRLGVFDTSTLVVADRPPADAPAIGEVRYVVDRGDLIRLEADVARVDPQLVVSSRIDPEQVQRYERQLAVARVGALLGGLLATLCFVVASVDRLLERRSHVATLVAIGVPRSALRVSQVAQLLLPLVTALAAANLVGWLIGQAYVAAGGLVRGVPVGLLGQGLAVSAGAVVVAVAAGAAVSVPHDLVTELRAE